MTDKEVEALERRLRAARQRVFSEDPAEADAAAVEITECKKLLAAHWGKPLRADTGDPEMDNYVDYQRGLPAWARGPV